mgnify:CR=1 FL=1
MFERHQNPLDLSELSLIHALKHGRCHLYDEINHLRISAGPRFKSGSGDHRVPVNDLDDASVTTFRD